MRLLRRIQSWGFPLPERQLPIYDAGGRWIATVDAGYSLPRKIIFEYQSRQFHGPRRQALDDERGAECEAMGWTVLWVTAVDLRLGATALRTRLTQLFSE
jgi:hypothetical protein